MARGVHFEVGGFYHIYNRGTDKRKTFLSRGDYLRFLALLHLTNTTHPVHIAEDFKDFNLGLALATPRENRLTSIIAYCLMPNHLHLLVKETNKSGISKFIQKMSTAYTMYFNKKNERTGVLFQGKYKARTVTNNNYLKFLVSYIHLNPIKLVEPEWKERGIQDLERAERFISKYEYSSYPDFAGETRNLGCILSKGELPNYFESKSDFAKTHREWLVFESK